MQPKVILITGGSSGIGKSIGVFLKAKGHTVYGTTRDVSKHEAFKEFPLLEMDVRKPSTVNTAVSELISKEERIDVLINNAGVGITGPIEETPVSEIQNAFDINFNGPIEVAKAVLPLMRSQKKGLILNITSIAGFMGLPYRGIYSASKSALEIVSEALRMEVKGFGINIVNLAPGDFATNIAAGRYHVTAEKESAYYENYQRTLALMNESVDDGGNPKEVAVLVHRIINSKHPKVSYKVGARMQKFSVFLKKILPQKVFEKLLLMHYKL